MNITIYVSDIDGAVHQILYQTKVRDLKKDWSELDDIKLALLVKNASRYSLDLEDLRDQIKQYKTWSLWSTRPYIREIVVPTSDYLFRQFCPYLLGYGYETEDVAFHDMQRHNPLKFK